MMMARQEIARATIDNISSLSIDSTDPWEANDEGEGIWQVLDMDELQMREEKQSESEEHM